MEGKWLLANGSASLAMDYYRLALKQKARSLSSEPMEVRIVFSNILFDIGTIQRSLSSPWKAIEAFHWCLDERRACYEPHHPTIGIVLECLASCYNDIGDHSNAVVYLNEALVMYLDRGDNGDQNARLFYVWAEIGKTQQLCGCEDAARSALKEAARVFWCDSHEASSSNTCANMLYLLECWGNTLATTEELNEAVTFFFQLDLLPYIWEHCRHQPNRAAAASAA